MKNITATQPRMIGDGPRLQTLQQTAAQWTLGATVVGMLIYTIIEYFIDPPKNGSLFFLHHLNHVAIIGGAVWFVSWLVIRRTILIPVGKIFVHLRRLAAGRLEYLDGDMKSRELADVAGTINQLVAKLSRGKDEASVAAGLDSLKNLRRELGRVSDSLGEDAVPVMRALTSLEGELLHLLQEVPASSPACCAHGGSECLSPGN